MHSWDDSKKPHFFYLSMLHFPFSSKLIWGNDSIGQGRYLSHLYRMKSTSSPNLSCINLLLPFPFLAVVFEERGSQAQSGFHFDPSADNRLIDTDITFTILSDQSPTVLIKSIKVSLVWSLFFPNALPLSCFSIPITFFSHTHVHTVLNYAVGVCHIKICTCT